MEQRSHKPRVGVFSLTGCAGDVLVLLNAERELPALAERVELAAFPMASSQPDPGGALDLALVEGSVCSGKDREALLAIRARSRALMAIGTCAVWGGIPAMVNHIPLAELKAEVYGDREALPDASEALPVTAFVPVEFTLTGCPIEKHELLEALAAILAGTSPRSRDYSVCAECRMAEQVCLVQSRNQVCCGPITAGGCHARCIHYRQPCYGCRGPLEDPAYDAASQLFTGQGLSKEEVIAAIRQYSAPAWVERHLVRQWHRGAGNREEPR